MSDPTTPVSIEKYRSDFRCTLKWSIPCFIVFFVMGTVMTYISRSQLNTLTYATEFLLEPPTINSTYVYGNMNTTCDLIGYSLGILLNNHTVITLQSERPCDHNSVICPMEFRNSMLAQATKCSADLADESFTRSSSDDWIEERKQIFGMGVFFIALSVVMLFVVVVALILYNRVNKQFKRSMVAWISAKIKARDQEHSKMTHDLVEMGNQDSSNAEGGEEEEVEEMNQSFEIDTV
jgi:hypothetical protein